MTVVLAGFALGISLIVAIGPQNAMLIKQGIKREHIGVAIIACFASEVVMTLSGIGGVGYLVRNYPQVLVILKYLGAAYLSYFTYLCFRDALRPETATLEAQAPATSSQPETISAFDGSTSTGTTGGATKVRTRTVSTVSSTTATKVALTALGFTWLNPAAYVDVIVMLGGIANQYGPQARWLFGAGSIAAASLWFPLIGYGAARFSHVLSRPKVWRVINFTIGLIMIALTIKLLTH